MGVLTEIDLPCGIVTLDWPQKRNALGPAEAREFADALRQVADEPAVKGVVVTGNGAFCAGGDLKGMVARADLSPEERRQLVYGAFQGMIKTIVGLPVPTFAAVDGPAVGMGFDIALACDARIVGPGGWFRQGWAGIGLIPGTGGELLLRLRAPSALWRLIPGQPKVDGAAAEQLGLAEAASAEFADARGAAVARVHLLGGISRAALEGYVRLHRADLRARLGDHLAECLATQVALLSDPEFPGRAASAVRPPRLPDIP
jgi:enoyl-CoA hydratase/carnithine racemase